MKNKIIVTLLTITFTLTFPHLTLASATPTPALSKGAGEISPTSSETFEQKLNQQMTNLKEKIASRVAQLNLVEKRGIIGTVSETSDNQITLLDLHQNSRIVDIDEITKFSSPSNKSSFGISDLNKSATVSVLGTYNKQSKRVLARFISTATLPRFINGIISDIDPKNFIVTVTTADNKTHKVDIETVTKIQTYDKDEEDILKYGFSKLQIGDRVYITGYPEKNDPTLTMATRLLVILHLPKNPKINTQTTAPSTQSPTISPSSTL